MRVIQTGESEGWESASLLPRGKDEFGNDALLFDEKPIRTDLSGERPILALLDVLAACGLPVKTRAKLDARGTPQKYHFRKSMGLQELRVIDLGDAYRVAMQGRSAECREFRDFQVELLKRIARGETINPRRLTRTRSRWCSRRPCC